MNEIETLRATVARLEADNEALTKTVDALIEAVEAQQSGLERGGSFRLFDRSVALEHTVSQRTQQLEQAIHDLQETQTQLLHAQKLEAVGQLAAGIAHEVNTPMQYIGDNVQFLQKAVSRLFDVVDVANEAVQGTEVERKLARAFKKSKVDFLRDRVPRAIEQTLEGVKAVSRIVGAMKEFSHPGSDTMDPTDLNAVLETTLTVSRNEWKYVAEIERDFADDLPVVYAHSSELGQVFLNMVVNASHAIADAKREEGGKIRVRTFTTPDGAVVEISDNGCGMPQHVIDRAFDPFFTTKGVGRGTGQGLAIAHSIIKDHKGRIDVYSEPGQGTRFLITLPAEQVSEAAE